MVTDEYKGEKMEKGKLGVVLSDSEKLGYAIAEEFSYLEPGGVRLD